MIKQIIAIAICLQSLTGFSEEYTFCVDDPTKYPARSKELQDIRAADQADRQGGTMQPEALFRDRQRRMRVGEIFGEGCLKTAEDFEAAGLVYQHGEQSDHFWQSFTWSKRAYELSGNPAYKISMANGIDRYLVTIGQRQLFARQAMKPLGESCWCLHQTESTFPDNLRLEYTGKTLKDQLDWIDTLNKNTACPPAKQCSLELAPTPKGTVPGFW